MIKKLAALAFALTSASAMAVVWSSHTMTVNGVSCPDSSVTILATTIAITVKNCAGVPPVVPVVPPVVVPPVVVPPVVVVDPNKITSIEGYTIPSPVSKVAQQPGAVHAGQMGGGTTANREIRAWAISTAGRCSNATPPINTLWYHNIDLAAYGGQNSIDMFDFGPNEAVSYGFTPTLPAGATSSVTKFFMTFGSTGTPAATYLTVSKSPCDFDSAKFAAGNPCYATGVNENGMTVQTTNAATSPVCKLTPGVKYYINVRFQDARPFPTGTPNADACAAQLTTRPGYASCGFLIQMQTY